jgi:hypothetical protein
MVPENSNLKKSKKLLLNWGIVWGLLFATISLDLYLNYRQKNIEGNTYRSQYQAKAKEVDSLQVVKSQLEKELFEMRSKQEQSAVPGQLKNLDNRAAIIAKK